MSKFLSTSGFTWLDINECELNEYTSNSSKAYVLEFYLEYPKEFRHVENDNPLALDKIEIKGDMLSSYQ